MRHEIVWGDHKKIGGVEGFWRRDQYRHFTTECNSYVPVGQGPSRILRRSQSTVRNKTLVRVFVRWTSHVSLLGSESSWNPNSNALESDRLQPYPGPLRNPPVLSPSSVLPPTSSHCAFVLARKDPARVRKILVFQVFEVFKKKSCWFWNCLSQGVCLRTPADGLRTSRATEYLIHDPTQYVLPVTSPLRSYYTNLLAKTCRICCMQAA